MKQRSHVQRFPRRQALVIGCLLLSALLVYFLAFAKDSPAVASMFAQVDEPELLKGDVRDWEAVTSQFNITASMVMKSMGSTSSKIKMIVGPGEKSLSGHVFPVHMTFERQGGRSAELALSGPVVIAVHWHRHGYVTAIDWKGLVVGHPLRNEVEDIWWLMSSKITGDATLELKNVESGRSRGRYKYNKLNELNLIRENLEPSAAKGLQSSESWDMKARSTVVPHGIVSLEAKQSSSVRQTVMDRTLSESVDITFTLTRVKLQQADFSFAKRDNTIANDSLTQAKQKAEEEMAGFIKANGGIVGTFNKIARDDKYGSTANLGSHLLKTYSDAQLLSALAHPDMDDKARAEMVLAIQLQEGKRAEQLLVTVASSSSVNASNAYRAVIGLGQRSETSVDVLKTLADLSVYKKDADGAVANNALIQMAWLRRIGTEEASRVVDKALSDYQRSQDMKLDLLLYAQQATGQASYRDAALDVIAGKAIGSGKHVAPEDRIAAARLVASLASIGDPKSADYVKQYITTSYPREETVQVLAHFAEAYVRLPADQGFEERMKDMLNQGQGAQAKHLYFKMLSGSPDRCKANEGFIRHRMANGEGTGIFDLNCRF